MHSTFETMYFFIFRMLSSPNLGSKPLRPEKAEKVKEGIDEKEEESGEIFKGYNLVNSRQQ